jgi:[ribosomal protein S5]-alanine N-acetyltransferase
LCSLQFQQSINIFVGKSPVLGHAAQCYTASMHYLSKMQIYATTARLILRELLHSDVDGMYALDSDATVHKYVGNKPITSKERAAEIIELIRQQYISNGIARWAVVLKETNEFIGWAGLKLITEPTNAHINFLDLGYRFIPQYWGQGFATECAMASLHYAFNTLQAKTVYAMCDSHNKASSNVLHKCGMRYEADFLHDGQPHKWFRIDAPTGIVQ